MTHSSSFYAFPQKTIEPLMLDRLKVLFHNDFYFYRQNEMLAYFLAQTSYHLFMSKIQKELINIETFNQNIKIVIIEITNCNGLLPNVSANLKNFNNTTLFIEITFPNCIKQFKDIEIILSDLSKCIECELINIYN